MKNTYAIEVDCPNCASIMETLVKKIDGVKDATVNFFTQKLLVEFCDGASEKEVLKRISKTCKKVESDFELHS